LTKHTLPPDKEASKIADLYLSSVKESFTPGSSFAETAEILLDFLEILYWSIYKKSLSTPAHTEINNDELGFFAAKPLQLLLNIICASRLNKEFFKAFERRFSASADITGAYAADRKHLHCLNFILRNYIPGNPEGHSLAGALKMILETEDTTAITPQIQRSLAGSYQQLLSKLVAETFMHWPTLEAMFSVIETKIKPYAALAAFRRTYRPVITKKSAEVTHFAFLFKKWTPNLEDLHLFKF
jgi:hypothetical protein